MTTSIDMILFCPKCGTQHVDEPHAEWTNPPHRSHLCATCGTIWRPADVATNGVAEIKTFGASDTWVPGRRLCDIDYVDAYHCRSEECRRAGACKEVRVVAAECQANRRDWVSPCPKCGRNIGDGCA